MSYPTPEEMCNLFHTVPFENWNDEIKKVYPEYHIELHNDVVADCHSYTWNMVRSTFGTPLYKKHVYITQDKKIYFGSSNIFDCVSREFRLKYSDLVQKIENNKGTPEYTWWYQVKPEYVIFDLDEIYKP